MCTKYFAVICVIFLISQTQASPAKSLSIDTAEDEMRLLCNDQNDAFSCIKLRALNFINNINKQDSFKVCILLSYEIGCYNFLFFFISVVR